jgi:hexosaminidase
LGETLTLFEGYNEMRCLRSVKMLLAGGAALIVTSAYTTVAAQAEPSRPAQAALDALAQSMGMEYRIIDNQPKECANQGRCFIADLVLTTPADFPRTAPLEIRFSFVNPILNVASDVFESRPVKGDLYALTLKKDAQLKPSTQYALRIMAAGQYFSRFKMMPNAHIIMADAEPRVIAASRSGIDSATKLETLPFVAPMTDQSRLARGSKEDRTVWLTPERAFAVYEARASDVTKDIAILPRPLSVVQSAGKATDLRNGFTTAITGIAPGMLDAALAPLQAAYPGAQGKGIVISIVVAPQKQGGPEAYSLSAKGGKVVIRANTAAGASHALRSLLQQASTDGRCGPQFPQQGRNTQAD